MIYRCETRPTTYQIIDKIMIDDDRLSPQALGVMTYLLGRPKNWEVLIVQVAKHFKLSKDRIGNIFKELEKFGYARLVTIREKKTTKFGGKRWEVFELPDLNPNFKNQAKTITVIRTEDSLFRRPEKSDIGKNRASEKTVLISTEEEIIKENNLKNKESVNECAEGKMHTHFILNEKVLNEKNDPSPSSGEPPSRSEKISNKILFRESIYFTDPLSIGIKKLREDLAARNSRYDRAHTFKYHTRLLNWSDANKIACIDWLAQAASFMDGDEAKGQLMLK